jgi:tetratricopeptide (TPR) repeat protein
MKMRVRIEIAAIAIAMLAGCAQPAVKSNVIAKTVPASDTATPDPVFRAVALMKQNKIAEGREMLRHFVATMPADWKPIVVLPNSVTIAYWDLAEMTECSAKDGQRFGKQTVAWTRPSYSQAWYLLGFTALEAKDYVEANADIDRALALEPDHPTVLNEKATMLQQQRKLDEAIAYNRKVVESQRCVTTQALSRAWRSQGVSLIDLGKLDEADAALGEALKVDPGNPNTLNELTYLERMRGKNPPQSPTVIHRTNN